MPRSVDVLVVEDNTADVELLKDRLGHDKLFLRFFHVKDGEEALCFLRQQGIYRGMPKPDLVLVDWNLPVTHGRDVIQEVRDNPNLKSIVVVMVTGVKHDTAQAEAIKAGAVCCIDKPLTLLKFLSIVERVTPFWLTIVRMPDNY